MVHVGSAGALSVRGGYCDSDLAAGGKIAVCIVVHLCWTDEGVAGLAKREGDAAALIEAYRQRADAQFQRLRGEFVLAVSCNQGTYCGVRVSGC